MWNQSFTFADLQMNQFEMESFELIFQMLDFNEYSRNVLIGAHSVGLSTMYRHANHEFHKIWLRLFDPDCPYPGQC